MTLILDQGGQLVVDKRDPVRPDTYQQAGP